MEDEPHAEISITRATVVRKMTDAEMEAALDRISPAMRELMAWRVDLLTRALLAPLPPREPETFTWPPQPRPSISFGPLVSQRMMTVTGI